MPQVPNQNKNQEVFYMGDGKYITDKTLVKKRYHGNLVKRQRESDTSPP